MSGSKNSQLRVIGVGNEWRGDDAAGLLVARRLRELVGNKVAVLENSGSVSALLEAWEGAEAVILADVVRGGGRPGEIYRFPEHDDLLLAELFADASGHAWGLAQTIALGRVLGELPPYLVVYGIAGRDFGLGREVSPEVARAVPEVARRIRQEIEEYLAARQ